MENEEVHFETTFYYPGSAQRSPDGTLSIDISMYGKDCHGSGAEIIKPDSKDYELWLWLIHKFPILPKDQNADQTQEEVMESKVARRMAELFAAETPASERGSPQELTTPYLSDKDVERFRLEFQEEIQRIRTDPLLREELLLSIQKEPARLHRLLQSCFEGSIFTCCILLPIILPIDILFGIKERFWKDRNTRQGGD